MITLKKLNVVKVVTSQEKADKLVAKGFTITGKSEGGAKDDSNADRKNGSGGKK